MPRGVHYQMTFCCEATAKLVELGQLIPTWHMRDDLKRSAKRSKRVQPALALVGMDIYDDRNTLVYLYYCPNCGKKVRVRPLPQHYRYTIPPEEVAWDGPEPRPRSGNTLDGFIAKCIALKPGEDKQTITNWAINQWRRFMK